MLKEMVGEEVLFVSEYFTKRRVGLQDRNRVGELADPWLVVLTGL